MEPEGKEVVLITGCSVGGPLAEIPLFALQRTFDTNVYARNNVIKAFNYPDMRLHLELSHCTKPSPVAEITSWFITCCCTGLCLLLLHSVVAATYQITTQLAGLLPAAALDYACCYCTRLLLQHTKLLHRQLLTKAFSYVDAPTWYLL
ncbi:hypothetical protein CFP56_038959 [Quercus suber]|uniref:Uncharacterized protein n=1 Tax=Quercus suber TaxID=58331 RepID=A0AAW0J0S8_QUESU